jgi:hypothetical protein
VAGHDLLCEYRGDGHIVALTAAEVSGIDALITHTATGRHFTPAASRAGRGWTDELWRPRSTACAAAES